MLAKYSHQLLLLSVGSLAFVLKEISCTHFQAFYSVPDPGALEAAIDRPSTASGINFDAEWVGGVMEPHIPNLRVAIVISYCRGDLGWLDGYVTGHEIQKVTIISKCGVQPAMSKLLRGAEYIDAPNVGRNDQSIAKQMAAIANQKEQEPVNYDAVVFLKDNIEIHRKKSKPSPRSLTEMLRLVTTRGFSCFQKPNRRFSQYHDTAVLKTFKLRHYRSLEPTNHNFAFESKFENLGGWLESLNIHLPSPIVPVCYGGSFAVTVSQIQAVPKEIWNQMVESLSRGDNIEEGHFAERTWAGLLSPPISEDIQDRLIKKAAQINYRGGEVGALLSEWE